jgi:2-octaprenyl-6-methoxyphenol hydroxylase
MISHTQSHDDTSIEFHRSGGPCTFVPCGDNQSAIVWVEKSDDVDAFLKLPKKSFIQALQDRSRGTLGQIDLMIEPESWPLMTLKANRLVAPKIALMAEAAHVLSPIGAQGLNLSLRDVNDLADVIINAVHNGDDVGSLTVLKIYEKKRMADMIPRLYGVDWLNQFVANDNKFIASLRRLGLRTIKHGGRLRRFVMKQGLAPKS